MKNLYHGSISDFRKIEVSAGKNYKDFGPGFYATSQKQHAESIARRNLRLYEDTQRAALINKIRIPNKTAYRYNLLFDDKDLTGLNVLIFKTADANWLKFVIINRTHVGKVHNYDIVIGPTADSLTMSIIEDNKVALINSNFHPDIVARVIEELKVNNYPKQYYFGTEAAISKLKFDRIPREIIH